MSITQILQNESMILPQNESTTQENILQRNRDACIRNNLMDELLLWLLYFFIFYFVISLIAFPILVKCSEEKDKLKNEWICF